MDDMPPVFRLQDSAETPHSPLNPSKKGAQH